MPADGEAMRTLVHPGVALAARASHVAVTLTASERLHVPAGADLFTTVHALLDRRSSAAGSFSLVAGTIARLRLMTGGPGSDGLPMGFHGPHELAAPLTVVAGAAGSGIDEDGRRFTHCHAAFRDARGRLVGGHLIAGETIAGLDGIALDLVTIEGGRFARRLDSETRFTIFHPEPA